MPFLPHRQRLQAKLSESSAHSVLYSAAFTSQLSHPLLREVLPDFSERSGGRKLQGLVQKGLETWGPLKMGDGGRGVALARLRLEMTVAVRGPQRRGRAERWEKHRSWVPGKGRGGGAVFLIQGYLGLGSFSP